MEGLAAAGRELYDVRVRAEIGAPQQIHLAAKHVLGVQLLLSSLPRSPLTSDRGRANFLWWFLGLEGSFLETGGVWADTNSQWERYMVFLAWNYKG